MTLRNKALVKTDERRAKQVGSGGVEVLFVRKPGKLMFKLIFIACMALLCRYVYGGEPKVLDAATRAKVLELVKELHEAEGEFKSLVRQAEEENPKLREYKEREQDITEWYWGERLQGSDKLAADLYGSAPDKKKERLKVYGIAKSFAMETYFFELFESPEKDDLLKLWFSFEGARDGFAERYGMTISDPNNFFEEMKAHLKKGKPYIEYSISRFRKEHEFITDLVWDHAYQDATGELKMNALNTAVRLLTPQSVRDAEERVGKIRKELERTWPDWDEIYKEFKPTVDRIVEQESQAIISSGNPIVHASAEKVEKLAKVTANTENPPPQPTDVLQPQETSNQWWWYILPVVGAILGVLILAKRVRQKAK